MRKNCETCNHDRLKTSICDECYNTSDAPTKWEPAGHYKPDTNADRIRAMSDEELAEFLNRVKEPCDRCQLAVTEGACTETLCDDAMMKWLKQPADEAVHER